MGSGAARVLRAWAVLAVCACCGTAAPLEQAVEVDTEFGRIRGIHADGLVAFYGIPFAAPPVEDLRLRPPEPARTWTGVRECTEDKLFHVCPQLHADKEVMYGQEDCLYMNIYVPESALNHTGTGIRLDANLGVMFWIYGGGWAIGDGFEFGLYRGNLARQRNVVMVEHNYRLGALGFFAHAGLLDEAGTTGNYGLQDQQMALRFVNRNIRHFGGDPNKVALFGESAGGFSVCWHMVSARSKGMFQAAIMESGSCASAEFFVGLNRSLSISGELVRYLGCESDPDPLGCLRAVPADQFYLPGGRWHEASTSPPLAPFMPWAAVVDGTRAGLFKRPIDSIAEGNYSQVPWIMGTNQDEGTIFMVAAPQVIQNGVHLPLTEEGLHKTLQHFFNDTTVAQIEARYPSGHSQDARAAEILRDFFFRCPTRHTAAVASAHGPPVFLYRFNHSMPNWIDYDLLGDYHASELVFVFNTEWPSALVHHFTDADKAMADSFGTYWTNMAKHGSPNGALGRQGPWRPFNPSNGSDWTKLLQVPAVDAERLDTARCAFWADIYTSYYFDP